MDFNDIREVVGTVKGVLDMCKGMIDLLPQEQSAKVQKKIEHAEEVLDGAHTQLVSGPKRVE